MAIIPTYYTVPFNHPSSVDRNWKSINNIQLLGRRLGVNVQFLSDRECYRLSKWNCHYTLTGTSGNIKAFIKRMNCECQEFNDEQFINFINTFNGWGQHDKDLCNYSQYLV